MDLSATGNPRRAESKFPASNDRLGDCDGNAGPGTDAAMIEEITSIGFEVVSVNRPSAVRNGYTELMLFVAFTLKGDEPAIVGSCRNQVTDRKW